MTITIKQVERTWTMLYKRGLKLMKEKGSDYSGDNKDTFTNIRLARKLGIVNTDTQSVLVRMGDKFSRLITLCKDPKRKRKVKDETIENTIIDYMLYTSYLLDLYNEAIAKSKLSKRV